MLRNKNENNKMRKFFAFTLFLLTLLTACKDDNPPPDPIPDVLGKGIYIVNEGNFNSANASLTYYQTGAKETIQQLFFKQNNTPLGDVAQSITIHGEKAYIVVNNSGVVYVIDRRTGKFEDKITGLVSPRHLLFVSEQKAYISDLSSPELSVVDMESLTVSGKIDLGRSSEEMVKTGNKVFVANWSALNQIVPNNLIMVVNSEEDRLIDSITVGIEPNSMCLDKDGKLWVLCSGGFDNQEKPSLWQIDPLFRKVIYTMKFPEINSSPTSLVINKKGDVLYFIDRIIYRAAINTTGIIPEPFIQSYAELPYQLAIDPRNDEIYLCDALDYTRNGFVYRFNPQGKIMDTIQAGIIPGAIGFND